jgi:hypothetical protein
MTQIRQIICLSHRHVSISDSIEGVQKEGRLSISKLNPCPSKKEPELELALDQLIPWSLR